MKNEKRMTRINDEIARETANLIRSELADPRIGAVVSVVKAETSADLKFCKIWVSMLESEMQPGDTMKALHSATGFIRKRLAEIINLRNTPEIKFIFDDSIARGIKMSQFIDAVIRSDEKQSAGTEAPEPVSEPPEEV